MTSDLQPPELCDNIFVVLSQPVCGTLLQQPWETNTILMLSFVIVSLKTLCESCGFDFFHDCFDSLSHL